MAVYGYHRTSTTDQCLDRGIIAIKDYCDANNLELTEIFTDQQTGKNFNRPDYQTLKRMARKHGDIIILSELDRLGRDKADTLKELRHYKDLGVRVMILEIPTTLIDYSKFNQGQESMASMLMETINNMLIEMYATFAQAETQKREKRQQEGIKAKKLRGEWGDYGRPAAIDFDVFSQEYLKVVSGELRPIECQHNLGLTKSTFYRYAKRFRANTPH